MRMLQYLFTCLLSLCTYLSTLQAEFFFSNKESRVHLLPTSQMKLYSTINNWQGTLKSDPGSSLAGSTITFKNGSLETNQQKSTLKGTLDPSGAQTILLQGNDILHATPGSLFQIVTVSGASNRIEGQPTFQTPITLFDSSTSLTLALQKKLNASIELNGGTLFLDDDLRLGENVLLNGPGIVECNQASIDIWGSDGTWNSTVCFTNPDALFLNTHLMLSSVWTLSGHGNLNGQGNVLDLSLGGKLVIAQDADICISDLKIRGLNSQSLIFANDGSHIRLSNVHLELDNNFSMTLGGIFIDNSVTFLLKNHNFLVDTDASVTFDGVRGIIDGLLYSNSTAAGQLQLPLPIFVDHIFMTTNVNANLASGHLTILSSGTLCEVTGCGNIYMTTTQITGGGFGGGLTPTSSYVLSTIITVSHVGLDDTFWVPVDENVIAGADVTIDASGNAMFFAHGLPPQIIVLPEHTLTLKNIEFGRINENTFNIAPSGRLFIGENVQFEFNQNVTFSQGSIKLSTEADVFNIRGMGGVKTLNIAAPPAGQNKYFNAGTNTLILQNIELNGVENIDFESTIINGQVIKGAIALTGGARVNLTKSTNAIFIIEGTDNIIRILKNDISLDGALIFGDAVTNEVAIDFILTSGLTTENQVRFGDNFAYIYSEKGKAGLIFDDYLVNVINKGSNAFVMDQGGYLEGNDLFIGGFPIKQLSPDINLSRGLLLSSDQTNAIDPTFIRSISKQMIESQRPLTAYQLKKQKDKQNSDEQNLDEQIRNDITELTLLLEQENGTRALNTPTPLTSQIDFETKIKLSSAVGNIQMKDGSQILEFGIDQGNPLNIIMSENCVIEQGSSATKLKTTDALYVLGRGNILRITNLFEIEGSIFLDDGAELIIECDRQNNNVTPKVLFGSDSSPAHLTIPQDGRFTIKGHGEFLLAPNSTLTSLSNNTPAELFLRDLITLGMNGSGLATISGNLSISLDHLAEICLGKGQHLLIGTELSQQNRNVVTITVDHNSRIRLDENKGSGSNPAKLSIAGVNATIAFNDGGELYIDNNSIFEVNAFNDKNINGQLNSLSFGLNTKLKLKKNGTFILGENNINKPKNKTPIIWNFNLERATLEAQGRFKIAEKTIYGVPQNNTLVIAATAEEIIRGYVNRAPNLQKSLYFLDNDQNYYLRTSLGVIVPLEIDEDDLSEAGTSANNCIVTGFENGIRFTINAHGQRNWI